MSDTDTDLHDFDAPQDVRDAWAKRFADDPEGVSAPGGGDDTGGVGERDPVEGQPNWIYTGPRNLAGRIRALAIHPTDPLILYAGAASGGVFKTIDGGDSWRPLWHDRWSLSIGAIAISTSRPETLYVATGEMNKIDGEGIYRSDDGGDSWTHPGTRRKLANCRDFDALVIDPSDHEHVLAVGKKGIFRTLDGGENWNQYRADTYVSDVGLARIGGNDYAFFVQGVAAGNDCLVIRIEDPWQANLADNAFRNAVNHILLTTPPPTADRPKPARAKLAIAASQQDVIYVRISDEAEKHWGLYRLRNAGASPIGGVVRHLLDDHIDWLHAKQGDYNLCIAVDPTDPDRILTGMVELYVARDANTNNPAAAGARATVTWLRAAAWVIDQVEPGHHADHHQILFDPTVASDPPAWIAHDGGVGRSTNWHNGTGYPARNFNADGRDQTFSIAVLNAMTSTTIRWQARNHGLQAAQIYDLTQHPRLPTLYGCGLQDMGTYYTTGGGTWRFVSGGDGGFVAFDPNDPYRFLVSSQVELREARFPGRFIESFPPFSARVLTNGFLDTDGQRFAGDTVYHRRKSSRAFHTRHYRLYGTTDGETWSVVGVGTSLELQAIAAAAGRQPTLEVRPGAVADKLGLVPSFSQADDQARIFSMRPGPYALADGDVLELVVNDTSAAPTVTSITFRRNQGIRDLARAMPGEVAAFVSQHSGSAQLSAYPIFWGLAYNVEILSRHPGRDSLRIVLGGTAAALLSRPVGAYGHEAGRPVSFTLTTRNLDLSAIGSPTLNFRIDINGSVGTVHQVPVDDLPAAAQPGELARAINDALGTDREHLQAVAVTVRKWLRLTGTGGRQVTVGGTALTRLGLTAGTRDGFDTRRPPYDWNDANTFANHYDLMPSTGGADLTLTLSDGTQPTVTITFTSGDFIARAKATVEEVCRFIRSELAAVAAAQRPSIRCDLAIAQPRNGSDDNNLQGEPTAIHYATSHPDTVWVGGADGRLWVSEDDGEQWSEKTSELFLQWQRYAEAIIVHPREPQTVLVGMPGYQSGDDPGLLFKTVDGGRSWNQVGSSILDRDGYREGVHALELDPAEPDTIYAATNAGIFRSTDRGDSWSPFNEGLPNVQVIDLAIVPGRRTLRAATYGRGAWERRLTDTDHQDVQLFVRANLLDDGSTRPPSGGYDAFASLAESTTLVHSPDIKNLEHYPRGAAANTVIDGAELDVVEHQEPVADTQQRLFVQIHNRGSFAASEVRLVVLWADASRGMPDLPDDFWESFESDTRPVAVSQPWHRLTDQVIAEVRPGDGLDVVHNRMPRVADINVNWPAAIAAFDRIVILAITSAAEDSLETEVREIETLLDTERKVACRLTATRRTSSADHLELATFLPTGDTPITQPSLTLGGAAQPRLGLPTGGATTRYVRGTQASPFNLQGATDLTIDDGHPSGPFTVTFRQGADDIPSLATAPVALVRRYLARELFQLRPGLRRPRVRPLIGAVNLSVSSSPADSGETPLVVTSSALGDVIARNGTVAPAGRAALFANSIARLRPDTVQRAHGNFFYIRARNLGSADQPQARCRLFELDLTASPLTHTQRGPQQLVDLERGASEIVEITWAVGNLTAGDTIVLFAVLDHATGDPVSLPADFVDFATFHNFCIGIDNVAYRRFEIV